MERILQTEREQLVLCINSPVAFRSPSSCQEIDYLVPFWFGVTEQGTLVDQSQSEAIQIARQNNLPILAIIHNFADANGRINS